MRHHTLRPEYVSVVVALGFLVAPVRAATFTVTTTAPSGPGSLSEAVAGANAAPDPSTIAFDIPGTGVQTFGDAPTLTAPITIDGRTQPGYAGAPLIDIPGGVHIKSGYCQLLGLSIGGGNGTLGVAIDGPGGTNLVAGCYIGTGPTGTQGGILNATGIAIQDSPGNQIGGAGDSERNLVWAGPKNTAITLSGAGSFGNVIHGNWIGIDATGKAALPVGIGNGISITDCSGNQIGGANAGEGNVIVGAVYDNNSFNPTGDGVVLVHDPFGNAACDGNIIRGNHIGIDPSGAIARPNGNFGIQAVNGATGTLIGGPDPGDGNLISGNKQGGIGIFGHAVTGSDKNTIQGNLIGTDATGLHAVPNTGFGGIFVAMTTDTLIGGPTPGAGNLISGNQGSGIGVSGANRTIVLNNRVGTTADGAAALGNSQSGILVSGDSCRIGGSGPGAGNLFSANGINGCTLLSGTNHIIRGNKIGTDITGTKALGNAGQGVAIDGSSGTWVGGPEAGDGNIISGNKGDGVHVGEHHPVDAVYIVGNSIGIAASAGSSPGGTHRPAVPLGTPGNLPPTLPNLGRPLSTAKGSSIGTQPAGLNPLFPFVSEFDGNSVGMSVPNTLLTPFVTQSTGTFLPGQNVLVAPVPVPDTGKAALYASIHMLATPVVSLGNPTPGNVTLNANLSGVPDTVLFVTVYQEVELLGHRTYIPVAGVPPIEIESGNTGTTFKAISIPTGSLIPNASIVVAVEDNLGNVSAPSVPLALPTPSLSIRIDPNSIYINWASAAIHAVVQKSRTLAAPDSAAWSDVSGLPVLDGDTMTVTIPADGDTAFFRLRSN